jgi:HAE1 family hydrophobic/amphiphilic exporter-1
MSELKPRVNALVRIAVERRVTMMMAVLGVVVLGVLSLNRLPLEFMPSFASSSISVYAPYGSSSPTEVERLVVRPLEDIMSTLNGIERLTARASASQANVDIEFVEGTDMELAAVEVRDRIDRVRHLLPSDLERVYIRRFQSSDIPVLRMNLSAPWERAHLFEFAEEVVQRRLERLEGVANVDLWGLRSRQLKINLLPARMAAHGVDARDVVGLLQSNNVSLSGGYIREGSRKLLVRAMGELDTVEQLRELPLAGTSLNLADVAEVEYDFPTQDDYNYLNGRQSLGMAINKASNANLLRVVDGVKAELAAIQELEDAEGLQAQVYWDASTDVKKGLSQLRDTGLLGGALAILFMLFFLRRFRMTLLVAMAIPISLILTFVIMYLYRVAGLGDLTINIMSLMGLMLAVGMLVDNSIVVIESVVRHRQNLGKSAKAAALEGASEVAMPIICSTLTTICVFVPMIFLQSGGRFGNFMKNMGLTVVIVMVASLVVSLTVVPMAAAVLLKGGKEKKHPIFDRVVDVYGWILAFTLRHRVAFSLLVLAMLWGSVRLYQNIERSFEEPSFERQIAVTVRTPTHFSLEEKQELFDELYALFDARRDELEIADISYRFRRSSGRERSRHGGRNRLELFLLPEEQSQVSTLEIRNRVEALLPVKAGLDLKISRSRRGPPGMNSGVQVELSGDDAEILEFISEQVMARLEGMPFVKDVDSSLESGDEEIHVVVNRERALQVGLSSEAVARNINNALSTRPVTYFKSEDREIGMVVQYREEDRETLDQLKNMTVRTPQARLPIGSLASFEMVPGPRTIERENRDSKMTITVETTGNVPSFAMMGTVGEIMTGIGMPPGYSWGFGRSFRYAQEERQSTGFALAFALLLIYMIMAALFENFLQPLTILFSVPFAFIGVGVIMKLASQPRGNSSEMGLIILAGIVVNNAIVLIDHINHLRKEGLARNEAIIAGGRNRLRPIVMTAITTILGLSPMVAPFFLPEIFGHLEGRAAMWAPIGLVILGGLTTSTFLTLMIIPTIYSLIDDLLRFLKRLGRAAAGTPSPAPASAPAPAEAQGGGS